MFPQRTHLDAAVDVVEALGGALAGAEGLRGSRRERLTGERQGWPALWAGLAVEPCCTSHARHTKHARAQRTDRACTKAKLKVRTLSASSTSEVSRLAECASVRAISTMGTPATSAARRAAGEHGRTGVVRMIGRQSSNQHDGYISRQAAKAAHQDEGKS